MLKKKKRKKLLKRILRNLNKVMIELLMAQNSLSSMNRKRRANGSQKRIREAKLGT